MVVAGLVAALVAVQQDVREEVRELRRLVEELRAEVAELKKKPAEAPTPATAVGPAPAQVEPPKAYGESFLGRFDTPNAHVGGYVDLEFFDRERTRAESGFDPHRLVLLLAASPSQNVRFWSEIEIEHGGELGVEFSHVDFLVEDWFNLRGGILLSPLSRFNLLHDAPLNDLTDRPLAQRSVVPVVLRDAGVGPFGRLEWGQTVWTYEAYITNGFEVMNQDGTVTPTTNTRISSTNPVNVLRSGRPHSASGFEGAYDDFNNDKAIVGRLGFSPAVGVDFGLAGYTGDYDAHDDHTLNIYTADLALQGGALANAFGAEGGFREFLFAHEWIVEVAQADFERGGFFPSLAGVPREMTGYYAQWNYHFMPQFLRDWMGDWAGNETTFTLVARYDELNVGVGGPDLLDRKMTFGLNFRPTEMTVIKFDYELDVEGDDEGILWSIATYF
jgi:hypothetical protein